MNIQNLKMRLLIYVFLVGSSHSYGDEVTINEQPETLQRYWSRQVTLFSSSLDELISGERESTLINHSKSQETFENTVWIDNFFKDDTYLDRTNESYVKIRGGSEYDKRGESALYHSITARIKLPKAQERWQIFIGEHPHESLTAIGSYSENEGVGLKYFMPALYGRLFSNASIGFSGITNPYVKTRLEYPIYLNHLFFIATQNLKFSAKDSLEEWSTFTWDTKLEDQEIFRIHLERSTKNEKKGMEYLARIGYMGLAEDETGFDIYGGLKGRTKDMGTQYENKRYALTGVYEYAFGMIWRQKLWSDYLYYQIEPIVSFHEQYGYNPNHLLRLTIDLYFGNKK